MIQQGRVTVNGTVITRLGTRADPARDSIKVDGKKIRALQQKIYLLLNKPRQVISSVADPQGRTKVTDLIKTTQKVYPVGRLDYNTEGLILLTNDGEFSKRVAMGGRRMAKVYRAKVHSKPAERDIIRLRKGIRMKSGLQLAPCRIVAIGGEKNAWYEVTLTEGKNRQIREMFESVGCPVIKLRRIRIGFLTDKDLRVGTYRSLTPEEVARVFERTKVPGSGPRREKVSS